LRFNDIRRSAPCRILEKQLDLPPVLVDLGNGGGGQLHVVGQEDQGALLLVIEELDAPHHGRGVILRGLLRHADDLVANHALTPGQLQILHFDDVRVGLQASDEGNSLLGQPLEPVVVGVASIENQDGAGRELPLARHGDFVLLAVGDDPEAGQQAVVIEHQMQLDGAFCAAELRPVEDRGA